MSAWPGRLAFRRLLAARHTATDHSRLDYALLPRVRLAAWPSGDFWQRATLPLTTLMARNNLTAADLGAVELLGGGSRVPRLKAALSEALGGRGLDM